MNSNRRRGGYSSPPSRFETAVVIAIVAILVIVLGGGVTAAILYQRDFNRHQAQVYQAWNAGVGRPEAVSVTAGHDAVNIPPTVGRVDYYWNSCTHKSCPYEDIHRYPMVYPMNDVYLRHGCLEDKASNRVDEVKATATAPGGSYTVRLDDSRHRLFICLTPGSKQHENDQVVIWSDASNMK